MLLHLPIAILASLPITPVVDVMPKLDIARECRSEGGPQATVERCAQDEATARDRLQSEWIQFTVYDKASCVHNTDAGGSGSYVELLICLEMARDAKKITR